MVKVMEVMLEFALIAFFLTGMIYLLLQFQQALSF